MITIKTGSGYIEVENGSPGHKALIAQEIEQYGAKNNLPRPFCQTASFVGLAMFSAGKTGSTAYTVGKKAVDIIVKNMGELNHDEFYKNFGLHDLYDSATVNNVVSVFGL